MKVLKMEVGMLGTNCYIAVNEATGLKNVNEKNLGRR